MSTSRILLRVFLCWFLGGTVGWLAADFTGLKLEPGAVERLPYPHVVPRSEGGVSLRFAMVHDVLHERFARHGTAYYKERNRLDRMELSELDSVPVTEQSLQRRAELTDDLGVGLEMAGEHEAAVELMQGKLKHQLDLMRPREALYSTHANLGTFLILGPFRNVRPGNEADKATLREGLKHIKTAIDINPDSHFGREVWQAAIIEYMIALYDDPRLLLRYDMVGNRLETKIGTGHSPLTDYKHPPDAEGRVHPGPIRWGARYGGVARAREAAEYLKQPATWEQNKGAREAIARLEVETGWKERTPPDQKNLVRFDEPIPGMDQKNYVRFDEPTLGIVGMWRLGGGAHPYFAVALGETMLRVGQQYLAWCAFERAARLAPHAWPDAKLQNEFAEHCRGRQAAIESQLPASEVPLLRPTFEKELAIGTEYQRDYQRYEEERIAAGASIRDSHFYDEFHARHPAIATPVGNADWFTVPTKGLTGLSPELAMGLLFGGCSALVAAVYMRRMAW